MNLIHNKLLLITNLLRMMHHNLWRDGVSFRLHGTVHTHILLDSCEPFPKLDESLTVLPDRKTHL